MAGKTASLRDSAKQAMLWSAGLNIFRDAMQFGQMLILARLLDPTTYGMAAMATTLVNVIGLASFQHIIPHALQVRTGKEVNFHLHFTAGLALNGALFVVANGVAFGLQFTTNYVHLQTMMHVLSLTFLLSVPGEMRVKMLEREHDWIRLRGLQLAGVVVSTIAGISMAWAGAGVYSLIVPGLLASSLFVLDLFVRENWRPRWQWSYAGYLESMRFGMNRAMSNALNGGRYLIQNAQITQSVQFAGLGVFSRAEGLANMFCGRVSQQATGALYPIITRAHAKSEQFRRMSRLVLSAVAWVVVPIACFLSLEAHGVVALLYGPKWLEVVPLLPLAMGCGVAVSLGATAYAMLLANDQARLCLRSDLAAFVVGVLPMVILIPLGLKAYLWGALAANVFIAVVLLTILVRTQGLDLRGLATALAPPTLAGSVATAALTGVRSLQPEDAPVIASLLVVWATFCIAYLLVLRIGFRPLLAEIVEYLPGGRRLARLLML